MGELAREVQERLRDGLAVVRPDHDWEVEYRVAGTPVDIAGTPSAVAGTSSGDGAIAVPGTDGEDGGPVVLVELEWRRADPADNAAKLFRHLADGQFDADRVVVAQVFTGYYDLASGGVSSKRQNAEFVGRVAADTFDRLSYAPVDLAFDPPKRGGDLPEDWRVAVDDAVERIDDLV